MSAQRRILFINRPFQLRFSFYVCSWLIALGLAYPLIIASLFDYIIKLLALNPTGPALAQLVQTRKELLSLVVIMQVVLVCLTFLISIFMSHKIAGPLHRLCVYLKKIQSGEYNPTLKFRSDDYFPEIALYYNEMRESIQSAFTKQHQLLRHTADELETISQSLSQPHSILQEKLRTLAQDLRASVSTTNPEVTPSATAGHK